MWHELSYFVKKSYNMIGKLIKKILTIDKITTHTYIKRFSKFLYFVHLYVLAVIKTVTILE